MPRPKKNTSTPRDHELEAITVIGRALEPLNIFAMGRVVRFFHDRLTMAERLLQQRLAADTAQREGAQEPVEWASHTSEHTETGEAEMLTSTSENGSAEAA